MSARLETHIDHFRSWIKIYSSSEARQVRQLLIMAKKKPFVLRMDPEILKSIEKWAADDFRSSNGQIEWIIHEALKKSGRLPKTKSKE